MDRYVFWEVFRDTGDPICWLLTRGEKSAEPKQDKPGEQREKPPSVPG